MLLHSPRFAPLMPPISPTALISFLIFSPTQFLPELIYTFSIPEPFESRNLWNLNPDFCPYLLASSHSACPQQTLHCCPLTSAALWAPPLPFADAEGASLLPCPVPSNNGAPSPAANADSPCCPGQGDPVLLGVSRGQMSTPMGKSLCPLSRTSKFSCIVEAPRCSVSGSYSNCIQVKTPTRAALPPSLFPPLLSCSGFSWQGVSERDDNQDDLTA